MPYIKLADRKRIEEGLVGPIITLADRIETSGELNFTITRLIHECINNWGESYTHYDEVIGALECVKLELYRRKIAPYEDKKIIENGDV